MSAAAVEVEREHAEPPAAPIAVRRRLGVVLLVYLWRLATALVIAAPAAAAVQDTVGGYPAGDADLFTPGSVLLVEVARLARPAVSGLATEASLVALFASFAGLVPLIALLSALGRPGRLDGRAVGAAVGRHLGTLALLLGLALLAQAVAGALAIALGGSLVGKLALQGPADDLLLLGVVAAALSLVGVLGVVHDLARVQAVHRGRGLYDAVAGALELMRRSGGRAVIAYAWRAALALLALAGAFAVAPHGPSRAALVGAFVVHQAAVVVAVLLRASWLAAAMRLADAAAARARAAREAATAPARARPALAVAGDAPAGPPAPADPPAERAAGEGVRSVADRGEGDLESVSLDAAEPQARDEGGGGDASQPAGPGSSVGRAED